MLRPPGDARYICGRFVLYKLPTSLSTQYAVLGGVGGMKNTRRRRHLCRLGSTAASRSSEAKRSHTLALATEHRMELSEHTLAIVCLFGSI